MLSSKTNQIISDWLELPFHNYTEEDINYISSNHNQNITVNRNYPHLIVRDLFKELPFVRCTDYEIIANCMNNKLGFLKLLENNNLSNQIIRQTSALQEILLAVTKMKTLSKNLPKNTIQNPLKYSI